MDLRHPRGGLYSHLGALAARVVIVALLALAGCSTVPSVTVRGEGALTLGGSQPLALRLDDSSPHARFEGFDSAYVQLALPQGGGPLWIELRSLPLDRGRAMAQALLPPPWRVFAAFAPVLDLLDAQGRVLRSVDAEAIWETGCAPRGEPPIRWPLALTGVLVDPRAEGAVALRVRTSEAARGLRPRRFCDEGQRRWADEALLELRAAPLDGPLAPDAQAFPIARFIRGPTALDERAEWAWMQVAAGAVRTGAWESSAAATGGEPWPLDAVLDLRRENLMSGGGFSALRMPPGGEPLRERFDAPPALFARLEALLPADRLVLWQVQFEMQPVDPPVAIRFEAEAAGSAPTGALARIRDLAGAGGILVAAPCGVCAAGVCGPEMLGPCAAAFGAGAVIGGAVGLFKEAVALLLPGPKGETKNQAPVEAAPSPSPELVARLGALPARRFPAEALEAAFARAIPDAPDGLWLQRPWVALPAVGASGAGGPLHCSVTVRITAASFERPARATAAAFRLRLDQEQRLACGGREIEVDRRAFWSLTYRDPEEWLDPTSADTQRELERLEELIVTTSLGWGEIRWSEFTRGLGRR